MKDKETEGILNNFTLDVKDPEIWEQLQVHYKQNLEKANFPFMIMFGILVVMRGAAYLFDRHFFDSGYEFCEALWVSTYFVLWALFHYTGKRDCAKYMALTVPIFVGSWECVKEIYLLDYQKNSKMNACPQETLVRLTFYF